EKIEPEKMPPQKQPLRKVLLAIFFVLVALVVLLCIGLFATKKPAESPKSPSLPQSSQITQSVSEPVQSVAPVVSSQEPPAPQLPEIPRNEWYMKLVNSDNPLPDGFDTKTAPLGAGYHFDERAVEALNNLLDAAQADGVKLKLVSGFRSFERQKVLYNNALATLKRNGKTAEEAEAEASFTVQKPGETEHNLGLAADILAFNFQQKIAAFDETPEFKWLLENAAKYGFILRYPKDKTDITGTEYKPWHYRYVGEEQAKLITESGLCLEEYLAQ
ncbi:MAG: D-alanyl-D-alanine carboxypeptidase family protein, partial [Oscillospiraceae bacterium]